jgi:hypothetical protein
VADVFEPGSYELKTDNLPILGTLAGWKYGFNSPFRSEVYFISTKQLTDLKWGTPNPVMLRDPEFGPIRIRAFGTYAVRAANARALLTELVGTDKEFGADAVTELLRSIIVSTLSEILSNAGIPALDLASRYTEFGETLRKAVQEKIDDEYGLEIPQLVIVNISFPEAVEKALDTRTSIGVIGDLGRFQQYQLGQALGMPGGQGGAAAEGAGLGLGMALAGRMLQPGFAAGAAGPMPAAGALPPGPPFRHLRLPPGTWQQTVSLTVPSLLISSQRESLPAKSAAQHLSGLLACPSGRLPARFPSWRPPLVPRRHRQFPAPEPRKIRLDSCLLKKTRHRLQHPLTQPREFVPWKRDRRRPGTHVPLCSVRR